MLYFASCKEPQHHRGKCYNIATGDMWNHEKLIVAGVELFAPERYMVNAHQNGMREAEARYQRQVMQGKDSTEQAEIEYQRVCKKLDTEYRRAYSTLLAARKDPIMQWIHNLQNEEERTLLCFCTERYKHGEQFLPKFCHRQLVAQLIERYRPDITTIRH